jgi:hypothetical protein
VATGALEAHGGERRVLVRFADDEIAEGMADLDLDRPEFALRFDGPAQNSQEAIIPIASVKRVLIERANLIEAIPADVLRKVALHFWDGEVIKGLLRDVPRRQRHGMVVELISPENDRAELFALPYHAIKAVFFLRTWDTRPLQFDHVEGAARWSLPRHEAPLVELLSEIRGLRGLRHRGQISAVEYERRRSQVLNRI